SCEPRRSVLQRPIDPTDLVVLAPGIIVAALRSQEFVAGQEHRHALRKQQSGYQIFRLAQAQSIDRRIARRSFDTAVPTVVEFGTVDLTLSVHAVVLSIIADQIVERETVVTRNEIDRMNRPAAGRPIEI